MNICDIIVTKIFYLVVKISNILFVKGTNSMKRLCDILNEQVQRPNPNELGKTNSCWEFISSLFKDNSKSCKKALITFTIQKDGIVYFSVNDGTEFETQFTRAEALDCIDIAKAHGLGVSKVCPDDKSGFDEVECFIFFTFTPSNITDSEE